MIKEVVKDKETAQLETTEADLTEWIQITLKAVISDQYEDSSAGKDISVFKFNINHKIQKIVEIMATDEINGFYMHKGKYLNSSMLGESFVKMFVKDQDIISTFASKTGGNVQGMKWYRFPPENNRFEDYVYMSNSRNDACCFVPKKAVLFMGFGLLGNYKGKDMSYKVSWIIDDVESEEYIVDYTIDQIDEKWKSYHLDIKKMLGVQYIPCNEGSKIVVRAKQNYEGHEYMREEINRVFYGHSGHQRKKEKIEGQEWDFDMTDELRRYNQNSTGYSSG